MVFSLSPIEKIARRYRDGSLEPETVLKQCHREFMARNGLLNAIVTPTFEAAREQIEKIKCCRNSSPLWGIPMVFKDNIWIRNIRTTAGSSLQREFLPAKNATAVSELFKLGAIIIGKSNTHEWALGPTNEISCFGPCRNPWNPNKITGGSSGGSACAVATGMAVAALGTDTGGSIRIPAALCGVVGFKPTNGIISTRNVFPVSSSFDALGPITRSVLDAAYVTEAASGGMGSIGKVQLGGCLNEVDGLKGVTLGIPVDKYFSITSPQIEGIFSQAIQKFEALGAHLVEVSMPYSEHYAFIGSTIMCSEAAYYHRRQLEKNKLNFSPGVRERLERGMNYSSIEYLDAKHLNTMLRNEYDLLMQDVDAIICPTSPVEAHDIGRKFETVLHKGQKGQELFAEYARYTRYANFVHAPSLSIPCGFTTEGMPVGLMLTGRSGNDIDILRIGYAYEKSIGGFVQLKL